MQHFAIVRDKNTGKPKFDDPSTCHPIQAGMMSRTEREELGIHAGPWGITADGPVPLDKRGDDFVARQDVRALGQIIVPGEEANQTQVYKVSPRTDHRAGQVIGGQISLMMQEANT